jgi:tetratricopeptide (TPR) repeat protein
MRIESLHDLLGQFPDVDGFWTAKDINVAEGAIRGVLSTQNEDQLNLKTVEALIQLVRVLDLQKKPDEARVTLDQARQLFTMVDGPLRRRAEIRLLIEEGRHFSLAMTPVKAHSPLMQAWILASEVHEPFFAIEAALMLAMIQPPKSQNEWLQRALVLAENTGNLQAKLWLAQLYLIDGWRLFDLRRYEEALESFSKAAARPRDTGEMTDFMVIRWCVARVLRALNRTHEALEIQHEILAELNRTGKVNGHVFLEIAECFQLLEKTNDAKIYFESAHKELSANDWYSDNNGSELKRMHYLFKKR